MVLLLHWVGIYVGPVPWLVLAVFEALYFAPLAIGLAFALRLPVPLAVIGGAGVWVAEEAVRTRWPYGGFGWVVSPSPRRTRRPCTLPRSVVRR